MAFPLNYWEGFAADEVTEFMTLKTGLHANEAETSAVLAINPNLVDMDRANAEMPNFPAWKVNPGAVHAAFFFSQPGSVYRATKSGTWGDARQSTPRKASGSSKRACARRLRASRTSRRRSRPSRRGRLRIERHALHGMPGGKPGVVPDLDPDFAPAALFHRAFDAAVASSGGAAVGIALEHADGSVYRWTTGALPAGHPDARHNFLNLERQVKFLLWSSGGLSHLRAGARRSHDATPAALRPDRDRRVRPGHHGPARLRAAVRDSGGRTRRPAGGEGAARCRLGRHLNGCRIGFDLGASDRKAAAVVDGEVVFSEEVDWNPVPQSNPQWHFDQIMDSLKRAAAHLPRVDAIGGSSAGVFVQNHVKLATLVPRRAAGRVRAPREGAVSRDQGGVGRHPVRDRQRRGSHGARRIDVARRQRRARRRAGLEPGRAATSRPRATSRRG